MHNEIPRRDHEAFTPFRHLGIAFLLFAMPLVSYGQQTEPGAVTGFGQVHLQISCQPEVAKSRKAVLSTRPTSRGCGANNLQVNC